MYVIIWNDLISCLAHILFDDAMETNKSTNTRGPNDFVRQFMEIVNEAGWYVKLHRQYYPLIINYLFLLNR